MVKNIWNRRPKAKTIFKAVLLASSPATVWAFDLGTASSTSGSSVVAPADTPTQGSLTATEPQSVIGQQYIENNMTGMSNYIEAAAIAPSVWSYSPNGPGGNDNPGLTLRGFQDGQYNVLFDGIPFSDGADFTHHATSYIDAQDMGSMVIDRGPGGASTLGDATFGGSIYVNSKNPLADPTATLRVQQGSFDSKLIGAQFDTGVMQNYGDTSAFIDFNHYSTNGALTNDYLDRSNLLIKLSRPLSDNTTLTFLAMANQSFQNASLGATASEIARYGTNYGLNQNPNSQAYVGYNHDLFNSTFSYIDLKSQQGTWTLDNKFYANSYSHNALQGYDPNGNGGVGGANGTPYGANNIPGITGLTAYSTFGDTFRATKAMGNDDLNTGIWIERQIHHSWNNNVDLTLGGATLANGAPIGPAALGNTAAGYAEENSALNTIQPYVEYVWRPNDRWAITPGLKYDDINRTQLNQGGFITPGIPASVSATYHAVLPSLDAHYYLNDHWSAYGQAAEGFVAPLLSYLSSAANYNIIAPQKTMNYQTGTVYKTNELTMSGDIYYITNNNLIQQTAAVGAGGLPVYQNAGVVQYRGVEGEATYVLGHGFSLYGNASFNGTTAQASTPILNAPLFMSALGFLYNDNALNGSLIAKEIGSRVTGTDANGNNVTLGSYTVVNFTTGYKFANLNGWAKNATVQFQVDNILNRTDIIAQDGNTQVTGNPLFWTLFGRIYNMSVTFAF